MSEFLQRPVFEVIGADASSPELSPAGEIFLTKVCHLVYRLVQRAPEDAIMRAAAAGSDSALVLALVALASADAAAAA